MNRLDYIQSTVEALFRFYDKDGTGSQSREETGHLLNEICQDLALSKQDNSQQQKFFIILDENNDDEITLDELTENQELVKTMLKQKNRAKTQALSRQVFNMFKKEDKDNLEKEQLRELCNSLAAGLGLPPQGPGKTTEIARILDVNGDGEISFQEFAENIDAVNNFISQSARQDDPKDLLTKLGKKMAINAVNSNANAGGGGGTFGSFFNKVINEKKEEPAQPPEGLAPNSKQDTVFKRNSVRPDTQGPTNLNIGELLLKPKRQDTYWPFYIKFILYLHFLITNIIFYQLADLITNRAKISIFYVIWVI